ncbi:ANTAR domain-containing protein [Paracoccus sp. M683]|uniref:ANTAR domain-containing response regulator n=1 Tax=Paracoccus sp. M683 TaxID=2594268 RepID=UPI00117C27AE|nr:ANTAR domain-containing protein [Paracoccus sp. M683]TRW95450.1 ANTAR domain-containing protein [Paracoccus sp. M683]
MAEPLRILVVQHDPARADMMTDALRQAGETDVMVVRSDSRLASRIAQMRPDMVLIDLANPSRDTLEELTLASAPIDRPVAMFVDRSDPALTRAAVEAGVSAYAVDGLRPDRIRAVLDAALARFHMFQKMRTELEATRAALEQRKIIDRAKGVLMRARGITEDEAYALMRRAAMEKGRKIADVAAAIVTASELLQ